METLESEAEAVILIRQATAATGGSLIIIDPDLDGRAMDRASHVMWECGRSLIMNETFHGDTYRRNNVYLLHAEGLLDSNADLHCMFRREFPKIDIVGALLSVENKRDHYLVLQQPAADKEEEYPCSGGGSVVVFECYRRRDAALYGIRSDSWWQSLVPWIIDHL